MEVRRQIILCFIVCCCANIICTKDIAEGTNVSTKRPSEEFTNLMKMVTSNLNGTITAQKHGPKLKLKIRSTVFWNDNKSTDSETCAVADKQKGERGDKGGVAIQGAKGEKGEKGEGGDSGPPGKDEAKGERGSNGIDGQKGEKGEDGVYIDIFNQRQIEFYGTAVNPAYSCNVIGQNGPCHVNPENGFEVLCQNKYESCIANIKGKRSFPDFRKNEKIWLSSCKLDLKKFYFLELSKLSYLMTTNQGFKLSLRYSKQIKILEILCWNGISIKMSSSIFKYRGCEVTMKEEDSKTRLDLECAPPNYLPMDFHIEAETEKVWIELISLCFK